MDPFAPTYEAETVREIWNNGDGFHWEVGRDRDGLQCVEIRYYEKDKEGVIDRMTFDADAAVLIGEAMIAMAQEISSKGN